MGSLFSNRVERLGNDHEYKLEPLIQKCKKDGLNIIKLHLSHSNDTYRLLPNSNIESLKKIITTDASKKRGIFFDPNSIVLFTEMGPIVPFTLFSYVNPGDEVIYPSPGLPSYELWINYINARPVPLLLEESKDFLFGKGAIEKLITPKTKLIILSSPSNPTGAVLSSDHLRGIASVVKYKCSSQTRILSDETFENILYDGHKHHSIASYGTADQTIIIGSYARNLHYIIYPTIEEARVFQNLYHNMFSGFAPFIPDIPDESRDFTLLTKNFQDKRDYAVHALNKIEGINCLTPSGSIFLFPHIGEVLENFSIYTLMDRLPAEIRTKTSPSKLFQMFLLFKYGVATVDRKCFGTIGADGQHYLRISLIPSLEEIREGIERIEKAAYDKEGFENFVKDGKNLV